MHHYQSTLNKKKYKEYGICYCIFKILATSDQVWQLIGGFDSLPDWLLYLPNNKVSEGGCVRYLANPDGDAIVERLGVFNNKGRYYTYSIMEASFPVTNYQLLSMLKRILMVNPPFLFPEPTLW